MFSLVMNRSSFFLNVNLEAARMNVISVKGCRRERERERERDREREWEENVFERCRNNLQKVLISFQFLNNFVQFHFRGQKSQIN